VRLPEQKLWDSLRKAMKGRVYSERVENLVGVGRPDVDTLFNGNFVPVELKKVPKWPARAKTRVLGAKGLSQDQKNWHLEWRRWGGRSLIVVGVASEVFAFSGDSADYINDWNKEEFRNAAWAVGFHGVVDFIIAMSDRETYEN